MSAPSLRSTSVLTEHLEYPPVSLVDDIINSVNETMYKCTSAMEKYLLDRSVVGGVSYEEEIRVGVAKLESLMESSVDRNFDKLELYVLRNVLRIPEELLESNVFRLKHQLDLEIVDVEKKEEVDARLTEKVAELEAAFQLNTVLVDKLRKLKELHRRLLRFKDLLVRFVEEQTPHDTRLLESIKPIDDTVKLLILQLRRLYIESEENCSMDKVNGIVDDVQENGTRPISGRGKYIDAGAELILNKLNTEKKP
ncbi:Kinetochore-associated protein MTW1 [Nakaseomyces bracarensis]|uniref:Kinetochore-associated protein MTW1 n=1 Tax=Nakaseomyces bracarensis TaxID=273131 RepID=A0ABR4NM19_9SACH